ncbi:MAG: metallophosphoesterase [Oligoflexia bacterium]|nr:metallophosphoesterase [Oligoflexia bacterium]
MITNIDSQKMVVLSDLHLGNPFSNVRNKTVSFIQWAAENQYDICLNGDGFEISQVSIAKMTSDAPEVLQSLRMAMDKGIRVYYVVGNHDILFEHFLHDWGAFKLAPFLNVTQANKRIRIEHGHLYDPFFVFSPRLYDLSTWLGGLVLKLNPSLYRLWIWFEKRRSEMRFKKSGIKGEHPDFIEAAKEIELRGFDAIIFGHTHHKGREILLNGGVYMNPGSWMLSSTYICLENGKFSLEEF